MLITPTRPPLRTLVWSAASSANSSLGFITVGVSPRSKCPSSSNDTCPSRKSGTPLVRTSEYIRVSSLRCRTIGVRVRSSCPFPGDPHRPHDNSSVALAAIVRSPSALRPPGAPGVDVDRVDRTDVDTEHAVDALGLVGGIRLDLALGVVRRVDPLEHVDRAVLQARPVGETDVEVHGDVCPVDAQLFGFVDGPPHVVALVFVDDLSVLLEVRVNGHCYLVPTREPT